MIPIWKNFGYTISHKNKVSTYLFVLTFSALVFILVINTHSKNPENSSKNKENKSPTISHP